MNDVMRAVVSFFSDFFESFSHINLGGIQILAIVAGFILLRFLISFLKGKK